jgi:hypothetical protein
VVFQLFGSKLADIPEIRMEARPVTVTKDVEDPKVRQDLQTKLKELEALSSKAVETEQRQINYGELVDLLRRLIAPIASLLVLIGSLFVILSKTYQSDSEKWAYGSIGTILGYWLK